MFGVPVALLVYGLASLDGSGRKAAQLAIRLGDQSYALYLTHILSLSAVGRLWSMLPQSESPLDNLAAMLLFVLVAYAVAEAVYRILDKPIHETIRTIRKRITPDPVGSSVAP